MTTTDEKCVRVSAYVRTRKGQLETVCSHMRSLPNR
jgi:hypothetical protein